MIQCAETGGRSGRLVLRLGIGLLLGSLIVGVAFYQLRGVWLRSLHSKVMTHGSGADSVLQLAAWRGRDVTQMIWEVAEAKRIEQEKRHAAIQALVQRRDSDTSAMLATLIQPHRDLQVRTAAAQAIAESHCSRACARMLLHYLERRWNNEEPIELDLLVAWQHSGLPVALEENAQLDAALKDALRKNAPSVVAVLEEVYGLSTYPSRFAIFLLGELKIREACYPLGEALTTADVLELPSKELRKLLEESCGLARGPGQQP